MDEATARTLWSSDSPEWATPPEIFGPLHEEFGFTLDPAATAANAKCEKFYTKQENGLLMPWAPERVFCNPPYGRGITGKWVVKASAELRSGGLSVLLLPARTDTRWFHDFIYKAPGVETRFLRGRVKFVGAEHGAPFPSMIVVFRP